MQSIKSSQSSSGQNTSKQQEKQSIRKTNDESLLYSEIMCSDGGNTTEQTEVANIFQAILLRQYDRIDKLLDLSTRDHVIHLRSTDAFGRTPLNLSCAKGDLNIVDKILATAAASLETQDCNGWSPLFSASFHGHKDVVQRILETGADVESKDQVFGWTPLLAAIWSGNIEVVDLLLNAHSSIAIKDKTGRNSLHIAAQRDHSEMIDKLLQYKLVDINEVDSFGRTALYIAVQVQNNKIVQKLCEQGANMEIADRDGRKPLYIAYKLGYQDTAEIIINAGAESDSLKADILEGNGELVNPCEGEFVKFISVPHNTKIISMCQMGDRMWGGCNDGSIVIWDIDSGNRIAYYNRLQKRTIHHMVGTSLGQVWSLSGNSEIYVWKWDDTEHLPKTNTTDTGANMKIQLMAKLSQGNEIHCLFYHGHQIYGGSAQIIYAWDAGITGLCKEIMLDTTAINIEDYENMISSITCQDDDLYCVIKSYVLGYKIKGSKFIFKCVFKGHNSLITTLTVVGCNLWTGNRDDSIQIWDIRNKECIKVIGGAGDGEVSVLCHTEDKQILSGGLDGRIRSWDAESLTWKRTFGTKHQKRQISCMYWDDNSKLLWAGCLDKTVSIWK